MHKGRYLQKQRVYKEFMCSHDVETKVDTRTMKLKFAMLPILQLFLKGVCNFIELGILGC